MFNNNATGILELPGSSSSALTSLPIANIAFVSKSGNNSTAVVGRLDKTYLTIQAAINAAGTDGRIVVFSGEYEENIVISTRCSIYLYKGTFIQPNSGTTITISSGDNCLIGGEGNIVIPASGNGVVVSSGNLNLTAYAINSRRFNGSVNSNTQYAIYNQSGTCIYNLSDINSGQGNRVSGGIVTINSNVIKGADTIIRMDGGSCALCVNKGALSGTGFKLYGGTLRVMGGYYQLDDGGAVVTYYSNTANCLLSNSFFYIINPYLFAANLDSGIVQLKIYDTVVSNTISLDDVTFDIGSVVLDNTMFSS